MFGELVLCFSAYIQIISCLIRIIYNDSIKETIDLTDCFYMEIII